TLLPLARRILADVNYAKRLLADDVETGQGELSVGAIPTVAPYLLPRVLRRFGRANPAADIHIEEDFTDNLVAKLLRAELDVALTSLPIENPEIETQELMIEPLILVLSEANELAQLEEVGVGDLGEQPVVVLQEMHCLSGQVETFCANYRVARTVRCRAAQMLTLVRLVREGLGISFLPRMWATVEGTEGLQFRCVADGQPERAIAAAWHRGRHRPALVERFLDLVKQECALLEQHGESTLRRICGRD
ncbi:MAG: LysR substrate-binding domain-containing protein, partial [Acidobacteriota bacterium]